MIKTSSLSRDNVQARTRRENEKILADFTEKMEKISAQE